MSIVSPSDKVWWHEPIEKTELIWISIVFVWGVFMTFMMPYWHVVGDQNLSNETYRVTPEQYMAKAQSVVDQFTVGEYGPQKIPKVHPPAGSDIYLVARLWSWWPVLELEKGKSYRVHMSSLDWQHGFSLQPANINVQVVPDYEYVVTLTPDEVGEYSIICNEYCGIGHHLMIGKILVVE